MEKYVITIARHYGSGGRTIGKQLAKELGINFYDREILRMASDESGISEGLFGEADEQLKNSPLKRIIKNIYEGQLIPPDSEDFSSDDNLFNYQAKVIRELADTESCVIIGRCADFVLKDHKNVISVFVHADKEFSLEKAKERIGLSDKEVEKYIAKTDRNRADYYKYHTGQEWNDARNYDLCLDSSKLGFEGCVEEIKSYMKIRFKNF
ncbi:MAG: cytidylate kinase-like family protein [Lachnospiraceae bacterium]|nr:cytidylate kinase-like family protein [Lachnospiraceae bacterium]